MFSEQQHLKPWVYARYATDKAERALAAFSRCTLTAEEAATLPPVTLKDGEWGQGCAARA
jgi:hypothetical protein